MTDPDVTPPLDEDPRERDLARRSNMPAVSPWVIVASVVLLALATYVVSALL